MQFACQIGHCFVACKGVTPAIDREREQVRFCGNSLRNDNRTINVTILLRDNGLSRPVAKHRDSAELQVDGALQFGSFNEHHFVNLFPFSLIKTLTFSQNDLDAGHQVMVTQRDGAIRSQPVLGFGPKEVAGFVAGELASRLHRGILPFLHCKRISLHTAQFAVEGIIAVGIDRCLLILPVYLIRTGPLALRFIVGEAHVVGMIARELQCRCLPLASLRRIIGYKHAYLVAISKAAVSSTCHVFLIHIG